MLRLKTASLRMGINSCRVSDLNCLFVSTISLPWTQPFTTRPKACTYSPTPIQEVFLAAHSIRASESIGLLKCRLAIRDMAHTQTSANQEIQIRTLPFVCACGTDISVRVQ